MPLKQDENQRKMEGNQIPFVDLKTALLWSTDKVTIMQICFIPWKSFARVGSAFKWSQQVGVVVKPVMCHVRPDANNIQLICE